MMDYADDSDTWLGSAHCHAELAAHQIARFRNPWWNPTWHDLIPDDDSPPPSLSVSLVWGLRGKRSRPATVQTAGGGVAPKRDACSPATPLDYGSGSGFGSGASTSGGEEVAETSAKRRRRGGDGDVSGGETEAVRNGSPPSDCRISTANDIRRTGKKKTLGELQEEEKLLLEEKNMLQKEMEMGRKAYEALRVENQRLKLQQQHMQSEEASFKAVKSSASQMSDTRFILPDLNEPLSDDFN